MLEKIILVAPTEVFMELLVSLIDGIFGEFGFQHLRDSRPKSAQGCRSGLGEYVEEELI